MVEPVRRPRIVEDKAAVDVRAICVTRPTQMREALRVLDRSGSGILMLVGEDGRFERTVTDGDLRRLLLAGADMEDSLARLPKMRSTVGSALISRKQALALMNEKDIDHLPLLNDDGSVLRVLDRRELDKHIYLSAPHMGDAELHYVEEAFRTNWIAPVGPNVDAFEREIAELVGVPAAAAVSSGTAAIHLALVLLGVGRGDRVFCSTFTFAASANPIAYQAAEPVFIDSDTTSWNMSPAALEHAFETAHGEGWLPKAVIAVNIYGQSADYDALGEICTRYGVPLIEDAAESLGARYKGQPSGSFGRLATFSFNGNKIITTSGGGMLVSHDKELIGKARFLATQAREPELHYEHKEIGYNYRMSNLLAGVGRGQLEVLADRVEKRRAIFEEYRAGLADVEWVDWMPEPEWSYSTHWLSVCRIDSDKTGISARELIVRLGEEMIEARPVWKPLHRQPVFAGCRYFEHGNASVSDALFETSICLPSGSNMSADEIARIVRTMREILLGR
jgi:dTDP-4-amino-4,6-dideoxygalactose transaminase